ncbi:DUF262 domain-containing protein [Catellatospora chokoriensis]|uniref:DUF262 domain-containing protein n=1 Tax=Catellatospora chokoriensis TaxID=310353 RepID=A0A8J3K777_9ACTN|nr:DUF262 domain-containing protein [Catellatospora chokoriensis]GIF91503.1 hypothetical protein Cch02nite_49470 [Catellatospora chokoriensis]
MTFQTPITIAEAVKRIQAQDLVLPAIQREFVWEEDQITRLFDSILRGYPIGSFLSWKVLPETASHFKFYGFMREYHQKDNRYCPVLDIPHERTVVALLDGQQRLTALNVGLRGSYATKLKYRRWNQPNAFPKRRLYVNALGLAPENDLGLKYDFKMLAEPVVQPSDGSAHWFPVYRLFEMSGLNALVREMASLGLGNDEFASSLIYDMYAAIHNKPSLYFYEEADQSIDKVLDIFIRVNSGGTKLSHSDLLMSIATAQWETLDARTEIQSLVDRLNQTGAGFAFTKDVVLKSGLMLTGVADVGFKVRNFNRKNMAALEAQWESISQALRTAAGLLSDFGFSDANLPANSILVPLAYYVHRRGLDDTYRTKPSERNDRQLIRMWTIKALLKSGVWGSGLDSLLSAMREVIDKHGASGFPVTELETRMAARGKSLSFAPEEIEDLLASTYGWGDTFTVLSLLFPHVNTHNHHHVDHVFPRSLLSDAKLKKYRLLEDDREEIVFYRDTLANLQLLEGPENLAKKNKIPSVWAESTMTPEARINYLELNALPGLPASVEEFQSWCDKRYELLKERLTKLLGADNTDPNM